MPCASASLSMKIGLDFDKSEGVGFSWTRESLHGRVGYWGMKTQPRRLCYDTEESLPH
jgi:hypothetical protein